MQCNCPMNNQNAGLNPMAVGAVIARLTDSRRLPFRAISFNWLKGMHNIIGTANALSAPFPGRQRPLIGLAPV